MIKRVIRSVVDFITVPFVGLSAIILKTYRRVGSKRLKLNTKILRMIGVFPIIDHYYEPLFNDAYLKIPLIKKRNLPGINFRHKDQLATLDYLTYQKDFDKFLQKQKHVDAAIKYTINNGSFESGDADFLFNFIRHIKPSKIIEIGCGASTKIIAEALDLNSDETGKRGRHICIDPYDQPWLDSFKKIEILRQKVEDVDTDLFASLGSNDLMFIDSSHMIRPQGDVLHEYLEILPTLKQGVYIHVHDIFTPNDYPESWVKDRVFFWNEQYLLEAVLSKNSSYEIVAALNYLKHNEFDALKKVCPYLSKNTEPGSFYFRIS